MAMSVIHRSLFTLLSISLFIVLIALKLDNKSEWNWFLVFSPMFGLDSVIAVMLAMKWCRRSSLCRSSLSSSPLASRRLNDNIYCLAYLLSKLCFEVILCLRLQYTKQLPLYVPMIVLWICLISCITFFVTKFMTNRSFFA